MNLIKLKIWLKNAFQCAYCGLVIHIKCYDKTIEKSVCSRFDLRKSNGQSSGSKQTAVGGDDSFQEIHPGEIGEQSPAAATTTTTTTSSAQSSSRGLVSNLFNTIRQRRVPAAGTPNNQQEKDNVSIASSSSGQSFRSRYLGDHLSLPFGKSVAAASKTVSHAYRRQTGTFVLL